MCRGVIVNRVSKCTCRRSRHQSIVSCVGSKRFFHGASTALGLVVLVGGTAFGQHKKQFSPSRIDPIPAIKGIYKLTSIQASQSTISPRKSTADLRWVSLKVTNFGSLTDVGGSVGLPSRPAMAPTYQMILVGKGHEGRLDEVVVWKGKIMLATVNPRDLVKVSNGIIEYYGAGNRDTSDAPGALFQVHFIAKKISDLPRRSNVVTSRKRNK